MYCTLYILYILYTVYTVHVPCSLFPMLSICSRTRSLIIHLCACTLSHFSDSHSHFCHPSLLTKLKHSLSCQLFIWWFWCVPQYRCLYYWVNISTKMSKNQSNKREIVRLVDFPPSRTLRLRRSDRGAADRPRRSPAEASSHSLGNGSYKLQWRRF
jgi:hypothetical protein